MRWIIPAIVGASLMVYGQELKPHSDTHRGPPATESQDSPSPSGRTVIVVNQQTPQRQQDDHSANPPSLFHEYLLPPNVLNLALVIVGIIGIVIAICTVRTIGKQTNLMQSQFDQWVTLTNWRTWKQPRNDTLRITVDLVNPSEFPITLSEGILIFERYGDSIQKTKYMLGERTFISPNIPHVIEFDAILTDAEQSDSSIAFSVSGQFVHFHRISKKPVTQRISGRLECVRWSRDREWHATFTPFTHMNPETEAKAN
jgi:hypothetical protein